MSGPPIHSYDEYVLETATFVAFIPVRDLTVARAFYVGTLGLTFREESPFAVVVAPLRSVSCPGNSPKVAV